MLIINFEGREVKGLSKGRYDETFAGEDAKSNKFDVFSVTSILTVIKTNQHQNNNGNSLMILQEGVRYKHRFSDPLMPDIGHSFCFSILCNCCHKQTQQIKTKTVSK